MSPASGRDAAAAGPQPAGLGARVGLIGLGYGLLAAAVCAPIFAEPGAWGLNDWDQHFSHIEAARRTVLEWRQWPLWNPYQCGGVELLASPSSLILSPSFVAVLLLGTIPGMKLMILLHLWLGLVGMHLVAGRYGLSGPARGVPPLAFMLSSGFALHVGAGAVEWLALAWLPWTVWCVLGLCEEPRAGLVVGAALSLAAAFLGGGGYFVLYTGLVCAGLAVLRSARCRSLRPLAGLLAAGLLAAGFAAPKLLPGLLLEARFPRTVPLYGVRELPAAHLAHGGADHSAELLYRVFLERDQLGLLQLHGIFWVEYGAYLGVACLLLAALGCLRGARRHPELVAMPIVFLVVGLGSRSPLNLWEALTSLPLLENLNHPPRLFLVVVFFLAVGAGLGLQWLCERIARSALPRRAQLARGLALALPVALALDYASVDRAIWERAFAIAPVTLENDRGGFHQRMHTPSALAALEANVGTIAAYNHSGRPRSALAADSPEYRGELLLASGRGSVEWERFSPRLLRMRYRAETPDLVVVNQNAAEGWAVVEGAGTLAEHRGLLAVSVPAGVGVVALRYTAPGFGPGFALLALTALAALVWVRGWPGRRSSRLLLGLGLGCVALATGFYARGAGGVPPAAAAELRVAREASFEGRLEEAATAWQAVVRAYPNYYLGHLVLARELLRLGRGAEARSALERVLVLAPGDPAARQLLMRTGGP